MGYVLKENGIVCIKSTRMVVRVAKPQTYEEAVALMQIARPFGVRRWSDSLASGQKKKDITWGCDDKGPWFEYTTAKGTRYMERMSDGRTQVYVEWQ